MALSSLAGLTWDHPRGYGPLAALDAIDQGSEAVSGIPPIEPSIVWSRQPLEGFESTSLAELAGDYDALIIDHPHLADAVNDGSVVDLESVFGTNTVQKWTNSFVGPSFESYSYCEKIWAVPVDAATQVMAARADLGTVDTWSQVFDLAGQERVLLCVAGPHAFSTVIAVLVSQGIQPAQSATFVEREQLESALEFLRRLHQRTVAGVDDLNPIESLTLMTRDDSIALIPLVYGYVNFSHEGIDFRNAPSWSFGGRRGAVLGGTGIAITPRGASKSALREHVLRLTGTRAQETLVPNSGGQPAHKAAWNCREVDRRAGNFYSQTRATMEQSWVRPRLQGWLPFYNSASALARDVFINRVGVSECARTIIETYRNITAP